MELTQGQYMSINQAKTNQIIGNYPQQPIAGIYEPPPGTPLSALDESLYGNARVKFIKKVYLILAIQLLITTGFCFMSYYIPPLLQFQVSTQWISWVLVVVLLVVEIVILCLPIGRKAPWNLILLLIFTLSFAYFMSSMCALVAIEDGAATVIIAALITLSIVAALTLYAFLTKGNFVIMIGVAIVVSVAMLIVLIISLFDYSSVLVNVYCGLGVILFGIYLVIDTKFIAGGSRFQLSMDDYVVGALILYIDVIQIFLYILEIMKKK